MIDRRRQQEQQDVLDDDPSSLKQPLVYVAFHGGGP